MEGAKTVVFDSLLTTDQSFHQSANVMVYFIILSKILSSELSWTVGLVVTAHKQNFGKVMFLHLSVILFMGGACMAGGSVHGMGMHGKGHACGRDGH